MNRYYRFLVCARAIVVLLEPVVVLLDETPSPILVASVCAMHVRVRMKKVVFYL